MPFMVIMMTSGSSPHMRGKRISWFHRSCVSRIIPAHAGQTSGRAPLVRSSADHPRTCGANWACSQTQSMRGGSSPHMRGKLVGSQQTYPLHRIIPAHAGQTSPPCAPTGPTTDHPRTCGANCEPFLGQMDLGGSSPHMRGKYQSQTHRIRHARIIPAHAGQTCPAGSRAVSASDHPRTCGANTLTTHKESKTRGSSPHMRGKRTHRICHQRGNRIIPAHAGQTEANREGLEQEADHPRTCGANVTAMCANRPDYGSSPHMRGKLRALPWPDGSRRIIPAHAGQIPKSNTSYPTRSDHPRTCGANLSGRQQGSERFGSSPHMRGKHAHNPQRIQNKGIIPAHAGQTNRACIRNAVAWDHPRTCGANSRSPVFIGRVSGSSPHMRGKLIVMREIRNLLRIIPAHAGQTSVAGVRMPALTDHPRTCGANPHRSACSTTATGSSPHMRGKLRDRPTDLLRVRIIPAHAGQTLILRV